jgi:two-component system, NarL family, response regulator DevR
MHETGTGAVSGKTARITVFLLDDSESFRRGVRTLLAGEPDIDVIGEAATAGSALERLQELSPDVAVLDVRLPDGNGVSVCREVRSMQPGTACLMLTSSASDEAVLGSIVAGAAGYVSKETCGADLVGAVRTVAAGGSTLDAGAAERVMEQLQAQVGLAALSAQEKRVLELIGEGMTNPQIAERLLLGEETVKTHVSTVLDKLGMHRRAQAAAFAARLAKGQEG